MRITRLPKGRGRFRTIYVPNRGESKRLKSINQALTGIMKHVCPTTIVHGFMPGRSPVTNAQQHVGWDYTLSMDLEDFFDTVQFLHVEEHLVASIPISNWRGNIFPGPYLQGLVRAHCFPGGRARQGLPTSPSLSNMAAVSMDKAIDHLCKDQLGRSRYSFTRYADDITISSHDPHMAKLVPMIAAIAIGFLFKVNQNKTHIQKASNGRRMITGVGVSASDIHIPRRIKKKLRAARHQGNAYSTRGLEEWSKLKLPKVYETEMSSVSRAFNQLPGGASNQDAVFNEREIY